MKFMDRIRSATNLLFRGTVDLDSPEWQDYLEGPVTKAGTRVNQKSALKISAVYSAISIIAQTIASMPKTINRRIPGGGSERAIDHPLYDRLHNKPNDFSLMTSWQWIFASLVHKYLWGNWYTYIDGDSYRDRQFIPLFPDRTYPDPEHKGWYVTEIDKKQVRIPDRKILHIPHFTYDGVTGKGVIHFAAESLGLARAQDEFASLYFGKGTHAGGFVEIAGKMDPEVRERHMADFNQKYRGLGKAFSVIWLSGGATYKPEEVDLTKAQALESRNFSVIDVARWMNVPPHILKDLSRATFSNIEHQSLELVMLTFMPLATQIEQAMNIALFDDEERREYFVKIELKGLLRGDLKARTEFYKTMLDRGVYSADEVRAFEDINPQPDGIGKVYLVPFNMQDKATLAVPQVDPGDSAQRTERRLVLPVSRRTGALRRKVTLQYMESFTSYGTGLVGKEIKAVRDAVKAFLSKDKSTDFLAFLDEYYRDFGSLIEQAAGPLLTSYSNAIMPIAQNEVGVDLDITSDIDVFTRDYLSYLAVRHTGSSKGQLKKIVLESETQEVTAEDLVLERLDEWEEKRPGKIAMRESYRAESAFTRAVFKSIGVMKIISVAFGKSCPYCTALSGMVIGIDEVFLPAGEFQPEGADEPLIVSSARRHPPYHDGCDCGIEAGF